MIEPMFEAELKQYRVDLRLLLEGLPRRARRRPERPGVQNIAQRAHSSAGVQMVGIVDALPRAPRHFELLIQAHVRAGRGHWYEAAKLPYRGRARSQLGSVTYMCFAEHPATGFSWRSRGSSAIDPSTQHVGCRRRSGEAHARPDGLFVPSHVHPGGTRACAQIEQAMSEDGLSL